MDRQLRVPLPRLARLLDADPAQVRHILRSAGVELHADSVDWGEAASCLFDAWPRAQIIQALGPDLRRSIPSAFHPAPVRWAIPLFIVRAMEHQAALLRAGDPRLDPAAPDPRFVSPAVEDYVADILFNEVQPATVAALAEEEGFLEAYDYPPL